MGKGDSGGGKGYGGKSGGKEGKSGGKGGKGQPAETKHTYRMNKKSGYITNHPGASDEVSDISQTQPTVEVAIDLCQQKGACAGFSYQPSAGNGSSFRFFFKSHGEIYNDCWETWLKGPEPESEFTKFDGFVAATEEHQIPPDGLKDRLMTINHAKEACAGNPLCGGFSKRHGSGAMHFKVPFSEDKIVHECWESFVKDHKDEGDDAGGDAPEEEEEDPAGGDEPVQDYSGGDEPVQDDSGGDEPVEEEASSVEYYSHSTSSDTTYYSR